MPFDFWWHTERLHNYLNNRKECECCAVCVCTTSQKLDSSVCLNLDHDYVKKQQVDRLCTSVERRANVDGCCSYSLFSWRLPIIILIVASPLIIFISLYKDELSLVRVYQKQHVPINVNDSRMDKRINNCSEFFRVTIILVQKCIKISLRLQILRHEWQISIPRPTPPPTTCLPKGKE